MKVLPQEYRMIAGLSQDWRTPKTPDPLLCSLPKNLEKKLSRTIDCVTWTCLQINTHFWEAAANPGDKEVRYEKSTQ